MSAKTKKILAVSLLLVLVLELEGLLTWLEDLEPELRVALVLRLLDEELRVALVERLLDEDLLLFEGLLT